MSTVIFGISGGGIAALNLIVDEHLPGISTIAVDTNNQSSITSKAKVFLLIGENPMRG